MSTPVSLRIERQALTLVEAAQRLGVHRETLRAAIERGQVPASARETLARADGGD